MAFFWIALKVWPKKKNVNNSQHNFPKVILNLKQNDIFFFRQQILPFVNIQAVNLP